MPAIQYRSRLRQGSDRSAVEAQGLARAGRHRGQARWDEPASSTRQTLRSPAYRARSKGHSGSHSGAKAVTDREETWSEMIEHPYPTGALLVSLPYRPLGNIERRHDVRVVVAPSRGPRPPIASRSLPCHLSRRGRSSRGSLELRMAAIYP